MSCGVRILGLRFLVDAIFVSSVFDGCVGLIFATRGHRVVSFFLTFDGREKLRLTVHVGLLSLAKACFWSYL